MEHSTFNIQHASRSRYKVGVLIGLRELQTRSLKSVHALSKPQTLRSEARDLPRSCLPGLRRSRKSSQGSVRPQGPPRDLRLSGQAQLLEGATVVAVSVDDVVLGAVALRDAVVAWQQGPRSCYRLRLTCWSFTYAANSKSFTQLRSWQILWRVCPWIQTKGAGLPLYSELGVDRFHWPHFPCKSLESRLIRNKKC